MILAVLLLTAGWAAMAQSIMPIPDLRFEKLEEALKLTPKQKAQYDLAVGATQRMLLQLAMASLQAKQRIAEELAKPHPDLDVLAEARRSIIEDGRGPRMEARDEWRKLYDMLDDDQVKTLKYFLQDRIDHLGLLREFMKQLVPDPQR
jgi:hypothetical protein